MRLAGMRAARRWGAGLRTADGRVVGALATLRPWVSREQEARAVGGQYAKHQGPSKSASTAACAVARRRSAASAATVPMRLIGSSASRIYCAPLVLKRGSTADSAIGAGLRNDRTDDARIAPRMA